MIKKKIKKIGISIFTLLLCLIAIVPSNVFAETYTTGYIKHSGWLLADPSTGARDSTEAELTINGESVFCIDAFTKFKSNVTMSSVSWSTVGISQDMAKDLSLIAYFGTKVEGRTGIDWYGITQGLIWKTIHEAQGYTDMVYVQTPTNPDYATTVKLWNQILADVAEYKKQPSFANETFEVDADGTLTLTDSNNSLKNMIVTSTGGLDVSISGNNKLIVKGNANADDTAVIELQRDIKDEDTGTSIAFYNGKDQSVALFRVADPLSVKVRVKVNKFGELELTKMNDDESAGIEDTTFRITGPNGYDKTFTTDKNGKISVNKLYLGTYKAVETKAANGYIINVKEHSFTIEANKTSNLTITNKEQLGKVVLTKSIDTSATDGKSGDAYIKDNEYGLYAKEDITNVAGNKKYYSKDQLISKAKTDADGKITWDNLHIGNYYVKELSSNDTLVLNNKTLDVSITYAGQTVEKSLTEKTTTNRVNMQKIQVFKSGEKDGISGLVKGLQGCEFTFKLKSEVDHVGWENAQTYAVITTDKDGKANTPYLPYGTYLVKETSTPADYITAPDFTISITDDYTEYEDVEQVKRVNINNRPFTSQLKIVKQDFDTNENITLNSASFKIKDSKGAYITQKVSGVKYNTFTTNSTNNVIVPFGDKGEVTLPLELDAGTYTIEEVTTPNGFLTLEEPITFTITNQYDYDLDEDETPILTVIVKNEQPKGKLILNKTDKDTGEVLANIEYKLTAKEDIINAIDGTILFKKGNIVAKGITDEQGQITIDGLFMGQYELKETSTLDGYVLSKEMYDVIFEQKDLTTKEYTLELDITNQKTTTEISKIEATGNKELPGAHLSLFDKEGNLVESWISEDTPHVIRGLLVNEEYRLHEDLAPLGYATATDVTFTIAEGEKVKKVMMKDEITKVDISKVDATTSKEIAGAKLTLTEKETSTVIESWTSTTDSHQVTGLEVGKTYVLHEDLAPTGYQLASDVEFTIADTGEVQKVVMKDEAIPVLPKTGDTTNTLPYVFAALSCLVITYGMYRSHKRTKDEDTE